jgi:hypothetical protein
MFCILPAPILAQPQIGGGICSTASLSGLYSLTFTGRDVSSGVTFSKILDGIGTASFDGLSKVTFSLTNNTNSAQGTPQTLSGSYTMQSNCVGTVNIATGDTASFSLEAYNTGGGFLITGQDAVYSFSGSGSTLPASCTAASLKGVYAFNGTGSALSAGAIAGVNNISGLLQFDGVGAVTGTWYVSANGTNATITVSGQFTVAAGCTASATVSNTLGTPYNLLFTITAANGSNFLITGANTQLLFSGSGRTI